MGDLRAHGRAYEQAIAAMVAAEALPDLKTRFPLLTITIISVELDDAAIERAIEDRARTPGPRLGIMAVVSPVLAGARAQRAEWLRELAKFQPADGGPHHGDESEDDTSGG